MKRILVLSLLCLLAISCVQNRKADSASSKEVIEVEGRQGVACDGEFYYVSGSTALFKYTMEGKQVLANDNPFSSITAGSPAPNHIGDIDVYKGEIYAGCEYFMDGEGKNIQVAIYDAGTLKYKRSITWEKESGQVECCGLAVDRKRDLVWMADWVNGSHLYCYDLSDGSYIGKVALNPAPSLQQGIFCLDDGRILISCDDGDADKDEADHLYVCLPYKDSGKTLLDEAEVTMYMNMTSFRRAGEIERLCVNPLSGELVVLSNRGARIVLGMPKGFYDGYDREIHELYVMTLVPKMAWSQIDIHSHMIPSSYLEAVKAHGMEMDEGFPIPSWSEENHLKFMDEAGIKTSVLTMPAPQPYFGNGKESAAVCRKFNEEAAKDVFSDNAARLFGAEINANNLDNIDMNQTLTPRRKGLAVIAAFEAKGDQAGLSKALTEALDNGLTISEAKEALSQLYAYTGFPRSLNALGTLQKVLAARKAEGINDNPGKEADPLPDDYDALKQGTSVQTQLTGKPFEYSFVPATDYYLKAHLFGDIFSRNNLTFADREIVTVSAISALQGCEPQLIAHVSGARNMGVTDDELRALPSLLEEKVGHEEAERLRGALSVVLDN